MLTGLVNIILCAVFRKTKKIYYRDSQKILVILGFFSLLRIVYLNSKYLNIAAVLPAFPVPTYEKEK